MNKDDELALLIIREMNVELKGQWTSEAALEACRRLRAAWAVQQEPVAIGGEYVTGTLQQFLTKADHFLKEEQAKILPDNSLISFICDAVRMTREYIAYTKSAFPPDAATEVERLKAELVVERTEAERENAELRQALAGVLPYMEAAETAGLVGDEGCHWPVEQVRAAIAAQKGQT